MLMLLLFFVFILRLESTQISRMTVPKRIAILGTGPAGMSLTSAFVKYLPDSWNGTITLYEGRSDFLQTDLGAGVQLSGGSAILKKLNLLKQFREVAQPIDGILSRNKNLTTLFKLDILSSLIKYKILNKDLLIKSDESEEGLLQPLTYSIMRDSLQSIIYNSFKNDPRVKVYPNTQCVQIIDNFSSVYGSHSNDMLQLQFKNTISNEVNIENHDMLFCADGINSLGIEFVVRDWSSGYSHNTSSTASPLKWLLSVYDKLSQGWNSGLRISYGVTDVDNAFTLRKADDDAGSGQGKFHQYFGDSCYALIASYGGLKGIQHMLAVVYRSNSKSDSNNKKTSRDLNPDWNNEIETNNTNSSGVEGGERGNIMLVDQVRDRLQRAGLMKVPEVNAVFTGCNDKRWIDLGVRDRVLPLRHWSSRSARVVLLGDSAHAMPPFFGQGANQALQDSYMIGKGLADAVRLEESYSNTDSNNNDFDFDFYWRIHVVQRYEKTRKLFLSILSFKSSVLGRIEILGGWSPLRRSNSTNNNNNNPGNIIRDNFLRISSALGIIEQSFLDAARPRV